MKKLFNFKTLPIFFQSTKLGTVALLLLLVSLLSAFFAVLVNWVFGLIWLIVVIIGLIYSGQALKEVSENARNTFQD